VTSTGDSGDDTRDDAETVVARPLRVAAFEPFGDVISMDTADVMEIQLYDEDVIQSGPAAAFESDQPVEFLISRSNIRDFEVRAMERHVELTQTFVPLNGDPFVMAVAPPDASLENGFPELDSIAAFFVPGDAAVNLHRGTWHEVPFPLADGSLRISASHRALTKGIASDPDERDEIDRLDVEKRNVRERLGHGLRVELP
jgi:ureidoglycolate lyase